MEQPFAWKKKPMFANDGQEDNALEQPFAWKEAQALLEEFGCWLHMSEC